MIAAVNASNAKNSKSGNPCHEGSLMLLHLVLSVCCFPTYCLLTPLMSPKDKKCKLID